MTAKHYSIGAFFLFLCVLALVVATGYEPGDSAGERGEQRTMEEKLDQYIEHEPNLKGAITGVSIRDATSGEKIYGHKGEIRLRPASNMKLLTAAAALSVLGEDYTFSTKMLVNGTVQKNQLIGDLFLKGKGDPTLLPADFDMIAQKLKEKGIEKIEGDIIGDDSWYDDVRLSPDLIWSDEDWYYGAQISALTASPDKDYDAGTVMVEVHPGEPGDKPRVTVTPDTNYVRIRNTAETIPAGGEEELTLERVHGENTITIEGTIPANAANVKEWMAVWEPTRYALDLFRQSLKKHGITWTGEVKTGIAPADAQSLYTHPSMPLSDLLVPFMKLSNNIHAEMLVKEMGKVVHGEGSWEKGLEVVESEMEALGMNTDTLLIRDGSGISHVNLLPPDEITKLLYAVQEQDWFEHYLHALPVAGAPDRMDGGTLRYRMEDKNVQAKTGTIYGVSTLSGYVETNSGDKLIFSIMLNNLLDEEEGQAIENKLVEMIAN
ncbi:D-alanyl-D-alanine carboxypeptidase/D-alanyl-D-alanine-endopeptidase [Lentibacillus lipolyticus]|nr:D-alanyl-D-alanine carboxypeptidase/D-alanyl-D-alanine-endopeptidase [Lentibacillus lipolyticus]